MHTTPSNPEKGAAFRDAAQTIIEKHLSLLFTPETPLPIGTPAKLHKFDLVSAERGWVVQCKNLAWRANGGVPQAKITSITEAAMTLRALPSNWRKMIAMNRAIHPIRKETLAEYYVRLHSHFLAEVMLVEIDAQAQTVRWLAGKAV